MLSPEQTVAEAHYAKKQHGFSGFPVTQDGKTGSKLVGLISGRDIDFLNKDQYSTTKIKQV